MTKSIYEEALESVKQHHEVTDMSLEIKALEQAQKQEKLLDLYKKLYNGCTDYHDYDELKELQKEIKELERE